jgi:hypothetical protein
LLDDPTHRAAVDGMGLRRARCVRATLRRTWESRRATCRC